MRDGTGARIYRHVVEDQDRHGNARTYLRRPGQRKIRLRATPGTPEFDAEYQRAFAGDVLASSAPRKPGAPAAPGTLRWLVEQYYRRGPFPSLDPETQRVRRRILDAICERFGGASFAMMTTDHVYGLQREKAETPEAANSHVKALRAVFAWACSQEAGRIARNNPAAGVEYLKPRKRGGHRPWTEEAAEKYLAFYPLGTKARKAFDLYCFTGVRISDEVRLGRHMERDGNLHFTEFKGRNRTPKHHVIPILPALRESLDAAPSGHVLYLTTEGGKPYSTKGFGNRFKAWCRAAGIDADLSSHGIRKLAAQRCAENGATAYQMMALFGWLTMKEAARYTEAADKKRLQAECAPLLERKGDKSVPLSSAVASGGTLSGKKC